MSVEIGKSNLGFVLTDEFQRWREGEGLFSPVRLSVDPEGFFVFEQPLQQSLIGEARPKTYDLILVSDCSSGRVRKCRPLNTLMDQLSFEYSGASCEDNYLCLVFRQQNQESGVHYFVTPTYTYFLHPDTKTIDKWCSHVNALTFNQQHINGDIFCYLRKIRNQLLFESRQDVVQCSEVVRLMGLPRDQEKVLEGVFLKMGLLEGDSEIAKDKLTEQLMWGVYKELCPRPDLDKIFLGLLAVEKSQIEFLSYNSVLQFINNSQWDPRVNDQLVAKLKERSLKEKLKSISIIPNGNKTITLDEFHRYLHSFQNSIIPPVELKQPPVLSHPLCGYFINSSHNTYLTGNQLRSLSTVEMYIQTLLLGARCIELDCWDSSTGEPVITHGNTLCSKILFEEVIKAIGEFAFLKTDTPVILSFENHCSQPQQQLMARYCVKYLGSALCTTLPSYPTNPGVKLPSPTDLKGKIIIKNKKIMAETPLSPCCRGKKPKLKRSQPSIEELTDIVVNKNVVEELDGTSDVVMELSDLVNYVEPVKFKSFDESLEKERNCEMSSFSEVRGLVLLQHEGAKFIRYNSSHSSRIYPAGSRISSSNYMPQLYWNVGCQMVALNYQTPDLSMIINQAKFELGGNCGYILKPDILRVEKNARSVLDPFTQTPPEHTVPTNCGVRVISAHFLGPVQSELMVQFEVFGLPADTSRRRGRENTTRYTHYNGIRALWDEEKWIMFEGIFSQELALLKINVLDETGTVMAQRILPVSLLQNGYRHIYLRDRYYLPLGLGSLFVQVRMEDYVTEGLEGFADVLANPEQMTRDYRARIEKTVFKRETIQSLLVGEDEVEELQDIIKEMGNRPATVPHIQHMKPRPRITANSLSVNTEGLNGNYSEQFSPTRPITPQSYTSSFDYGSSPRMRKKVMEPQSISSEFIPSIKSISGREQIVPQGVEAVMMTNKSIVSKGEKLRKELVSCSKASQKQIESLGQERDKQLRDISSNYDKEIHKVSKGLGKKMKEDERGSLEKQKARLLEMKELKLAGVRDQSVRDVQQIRCKQERDEAQMELSRQMELKTMVIPILKASHQNQRQQVLEKVQEFEKTTAEKEIQTKKVEIINDFLGKTGTLCSKKATEATVKVFLNHQTAELERLQSQEEKSFERESNNILKQLEVDVKELELKFEQFDS